jgi:tight adherence protein C
VNAACSLASLSAIAASVCFCIAASELLAWFVSSMRSRADRGATRGRVSTAARRALRAVAFSRPVRKLSPSARLRRLLRAAGEPGGLSAADWLAIEVGCSLVSLAGAAVAGVGGAGRLGPLVLLAAPAAGFVAPDLWLARRARSRVDAAVRELPDMLDLFCVTVEAGLPAGRALGVVGAEFDGPLAREWRRVAAEMALGVRHDEAWRSLSDRLPAEEVKSFAAAVARASRHGVPLGRMLSSQASRARHRRRQRVREHAARAGPKIQLAVALLLVPSVLLMVAAAVVAELQRSGLAVLG